MMGRKRKMDKEENGEDGKGGGGKEEEEQRRSAILALGRLNRKLTQASVGYTRRLSQKNTIR